MIRRKTSAIVESGILAAIAVIFTLIGNYIPVLDVIVSVWWPLPIILCGRRNGLMWSVLCLLVTGAVVAVLISPLQAVTQVLILGILGLVMGEGMRRQKSPASVLLWGSLGAPFICCSQRPCSLFPHGHQCGGILYPCHCGICSNDQGHL